MKVTVSGVVSDYVHYDPLVNVQVANRSDVHIYPEIKRKLYSALSEGDEGELSIGLPADVVTKQEQAFNSNIQPDGTVSSEAISFTIRIDYIVRNPAEGLEFVVPTEAYPYRVPHMYTSPTVPDAARCWVPCVDNLWERCTWDLQFVVPRFLDERPEDEEEGNFPVVVVASGDFVEQVSHPYNSSKNIFLFSQSAPTSVQHIAFAAGPFHVLELPIEESPADADKEDEEEVLQPQMHVFCLPGLERMLATTTSFYRSAMRFYSTLGAYPFGSFKAVFVDELPTQRFDSATMAIISNDLLYGEDAIEQVYETRMSLSHALAVQWIGINVVQKTWSDTWLINGLGSYIATLFFRKMFGNNEYRFRLKKDMDRVVALDMGTQYPICQPAVPEPPDPAQLSFINLKAPLVLYILDRHLGKSGTSHSLSRVIPKILLSAISGDLAGNTLTTLSFLRTCRKISGVDPRTFAEQWIYGSGCPHFTFNASFNRKKLVVEFMMRQICPAFEANRNDAAAMALYKPVSFFEGTITVRIHEADGTPYEHVLDIRAPQKHYEVLFNTKYKRVRRNTKRYISRKAAALAAAQGDSEAMEDINLLSEAFTLPLWEDEGERTKWRVTDWTEEDEQRMAGATYEWIRMDADFEWIGEIAFDQPDFMWVSQLQRDRDVVAQLEALRALARQPSSIVSSFLTHTVLVSNYFYRVRMEAALLLILCASEEMQYIGIFHLFKIFTAWCYEPQQRRHEFGTRFIPRPNDFSNIPDYFVRKSIIVSLSQFREEHKVDHVVTRFLLDQLKFNDNTTNPYSDGLYISTLIAAVGTTLLPTIQVEQSQLMATTQAPLEKTQEAELLRNALIEIERYREMDRLVPSMHNVVSIAALEWYLMLMMGNMIGNDVSIFLKYTREGNYPGVRMAAFDGLLLMKWYSSKTLIRYIMAVIATDSSRIIRRHVSRGVCESFAVLFAIGDIPWVGSKAQDVLIEEDGSTPVVEKKNPKKKDVDVMLKSLQKNAGKALSLRECIMPIILAPDTDPQVRLCMLKVCDLLYRATDESAPTLKITLPPTPVLEVPPQSPAPVATPTLKLVKAGARRSLSSFNLPPPSPTPSLDPLPTPKPKLRLMTSKAVDGPIPPLVKAVSARDQQLMPPPPLPARTNTVEVDVQRPKKKEKSASDGTGKGLSAADRKMCERVLDKLLKHPHALVFGQPVDPVRDNAPGYWEKIKSPMDLSTMREKLKRHSYADRFAFESDFQLMIRNAQEYNPSTHPVHIASKAFEIVFKREWARANKAFDKATSRSNHVASSSLTTGDDMATAALALEAEPLREQDKTTEEAADELAALIEPAAPSLLPPQPVPTPQPLLKLKLSSGRSTPKEPAARQTPTAPPSLEEIAQSLANTSKPPKPPKLSKPPKNLKIHVQSQSSPALKPTLPEPIPVTKAISQPSAREDEDLLLAELDMIEAEKGHTPSPAKKSKAKEKTKNADSMDLSEEWLLGETTSEVPEAPKERSKGKDKVEKKTKHTVESAAQTPPAPPFKATSISSSVPTSSRASPSIHLAPPLSSAPVKVKIKSKESTPAASALPAGTTTGTTPIDVAKCKAIINKLRKEGIHFSPFAWPVDAMTQGCPTYYDEIKEPMDFMTLENNLNGGRYKTMEQFERAMRLIYSNCRQFNPPGQAIVESANYLESMFNKEWVKAMEKKLSSADRTWASKVLNSMFNDPSGFYFREPVDPVKLNIPHYFQIVDRNDARDLKTIRTQAGTSKYESLDQITADIQLMVQNAVKFNGAGSHVAQMADTNAKIWLSAMNKKRKEDAKKASTHTLTHENAGQPPSKKMRLV
ncbi:hypothetical protein FRB90_008736 [Tulasnella sp. 427]|nr:hypothetical protein FRB90_008736 [Tulasnella sp. 427]